MTAPERRSERPAPRSTAPPALVVEGLTATYGPVTALREVSIPTEPGRVTAVLGANGAGKTTLLRTISGLVRPQAGQVRLGERDLTGAAPETVAGAGVAHVPEGRGVITELTVEENLRLGSLLGRRRASGRGGPARGWSLDDVLELFPAIAERRRRPADTLSGGERQMLVIGRALLTEPDVLLLDEPSLGLAPRVVTQIFAVLRDLTEQHALTVVLVEQNARSALEVADTGVVLALGRVVAVSEAAELAADQALRHAYLGF
ncbi:ABC transporter ATP-binding protein [Actinomycetospora cinnamomea]|uniref:Branched-chain amino acid transport system ATP-binding protein n=1 Tax=Actinomycetospora cinnamomea TaxID=663609 RepID=A0A2U1EBZ6_9PSEU|nr:ABC transporter ATP-binding protein [Actinomycetospora cinnamomea]PVY97486.1 branched-chain amino acid transport system ATP-binding protein [Actinomycetospora cinnamomea]